MATVDAKTIIDRASLLLNDVSATRWTTAELLNYLNEGQLVIAAEVPNANTITANKLLVAGSKQTAPIDAIRIESFIRNMGVSGTAPTSVIREVKQEAMDAYVPGWTSATAATDVIHVIYNPDDDNETFYVYPPQPVTPTNIEIVYAQVPATIANATAGTKITVADYYQSALTDFVLYRAYLKDSEYGNQFTKAQQAYESFTQAIGLKAKGDIAVTQ